MDKEEISCARKIRGGRAYVFSSVVPANGKTSGIPLVDSEIVDS